MPLTSFPAELHSLKLRFVFGAVALAKIWTCFHFFEFISILLSGSLTLPFLTFLYLLLLPTLSSFFPTKFCQLTFRYWKRKEFYLERVVDLVAAKLAVDFSQNVWQDWSDFPIEVSVQRSILPQFVSQKLSHLNRKLSQFRNALSASFQIVPK